MAHIVQFDCYFIIILFVQSQTSHLFNTAFDFALHFETALSPDRKVCQIGNRTFREVRYVVLTYNDMGR